MSKPNIKICIAAHKQYRMPEDEMYLPIHVGAKGKADIGYTRDDSGDNISEMNPMCCELTGMYWLWKNVEADYYGLVHYRRHLSKGSKNKDPFDNVLTGTELEKILKSTDVVLPKKRKYYIEALYPHYANTHYAEHLDTTRDILAEKHPEMVPMFDKVMKRTYAHMFNMFVMKKDKFFAYCEWLFPILFELEKRIDSSEYDAFQKRYLGRVSELLLDVWLDANGITYKEVPTIAMEKMDWGRKITSFLKAKFFKKKYERSF